MRKVANLYAIRKGSFRRVLLSYMLSTCLRTVKAVLTMFACVLLDTVLANNILKWSKILISVLVEECRVASVLRHSIIGGSWHIPNWFISWERQTSAVAVIIGVKWWERVIEFLLTDLPTFRTISTNDKYPYRWKFALYVIRKKQGKLLVSIQLRNSDSLFLSAHCSLPIFSALGALSSPRNTHGSLFFLRFLAALFVMASREVLDSLQPDRSGS